MCLSKLYCTPNLTLRCCRFSFRRARRRISGVKVRTKWQSNRGLKDWHVQYWLRHTWCQLAIMSGHKTNSKCTRSTEIILLETDPGTPDTHEGKRNLQHHFSYLYEFHNWVLSCPLQPFPQRLLQYQPWRPASSSECHAMPRDVEPSHTAGHSPAQAHWRVETNTWASSRRARPWQLCHSVAKWRWWRQEEWRQQTQMWLFLVRAEFRW